MISILVTLILVFSVLALAGKPEFVEKTNPSGKTVAIPAYAVEVAQGVFYLGKALDKGRAVEGYALFAKPGTTCGNGVCEKGENAKKCPADCAGGDPTEPDTSSCYGFLAKGAKWKTVEPYLVDVANTSGLDVAFVKSNLAADIAKWEAAANFNILGDEISGVVDGADTISTDGKNEVYFADIASPGAIGVTIIWGIFGGPPKFRELVEWDQVYDDVDFDWGIGEAGKMDFESIATHELGHSVGLGDLYTSECLEQTMYGYASEGETTKRTLESGDIAGVRKLYR